VIGSACRCTIFQTPSSGRKIIVTRRLTGVTASCPPTLALVRSTLTTYASSGVTHFITVSTSTISPSRTCDAAWFRNRSNLLPSTYDRAKRVSEGHVLSMGAQLLCGFRVSFQELTLREGLNCSINSSTRSSAVIRTTSAYEGCERKRGSPPKYAKNLPAMPTHAVLQDEPPVVLVLARGNIPGRHQLSTAHNTNSADPPTARSPPTDSTSALMSLLIVLPPYVVPARLHSRR
jgi:hypothetical protein